MPILESVEIKPFIPARDFELSQRFYLDLGFNLDLVSDEVDYFSHGSYMFLLYNFYAKEQANNLTMSMLVNNLDDWWNHIEQQNIAQKYQIICSPPVKRTWGIRDFTIVDPTGIVWRIAENINN
jgi:uncharacterized glyoxalase superfamily protein PhnB